MRIESITGALADPTRLRIMRLLAHMELAVGELAQVLGQSQPRVSRHVAILCDSGLAERRREGSWVSLRQAISPNSARPLSSAVARMLASAEEEDEVFGARCSEDRRHLVAIRAGREPRNAAEFFARTAPQWDKLRRLLGPAEKVENALQKGLGTGNLGRLLDIGTGTGRIAELLSARADHVVALDRSPEMLRLARAPVQNLQPERWELVHGDFSTLPYEADSFDTVVLHRVLHYALEPGLPVNEAARVCRAGGQIVIVDLAAHEREELRNRFAHVRLGFTDEYMLELLTESGFAPATPTVIPGNGLTTKIWIASRNEMAIRHPEFERTKGTL